MARRIYQGKVMRIYRSPYRRYVTAMSQLNAKRERTISDAFSALEDNHISLASGLIMAHGNRRKAAHWMFSPQRALDARNAYEVFDAGEENVVWDALERLTSPEHPHSREIV